MDLCLVYFLGAPIPRLVKQFMLKFYVFFHQNSILPPHKTKIKIYTFPMHYKNNIKKQNQSFAVFMGWLVKKKASIPKTDEGRKRKVIELVEEMTDKQTFGRRLVLFLFLFCIFSLFFLILPFS